MTLQTIQTLAQWGTKPLISGATFGGVLVVLNKGSFLTRDIGTGGKLAGLHALAKITYECALKVFTESLQLYSVRQSQCASLGVAAVVLVVAGDYLAGESKDEKGTISFILVLTALAEGWARLVLWAGPQVMARLGSS